MVATPLSRLIAARLIRFALAALAMLVLFVAGLGLVGWIGSSIPRNSEFVPAEHGVTIMVETNGTHTGIVVPVANAIKDWRDEFPSAARPRDDGYYPTHLGIGWGEREVFLSVPTWNDLKPSTALRIIVLGGEPLMRVSHYYYPAPSENYRPVSISTQQYVQLVEAIEAALPPMPPGDYREDLHGTYSPDSYYEAAGSYTLTTTCNSWVGDTLADAGIKMGMWTPFAGGVTKWIAKPEDAS